MAVLVNSCLESRMHLLLGMGSIRPAIRARARSRFRSRETFGRARLARSGDLAPAGEYVIFQPAEVAVPRALFAALLRRVGRLRLARASGRAPPLPRNRSERRPPGVRGAQVGACPPATTRRRGR